jgi:hypothetical protein
MRPTLRHVLVLLLVSFATTAVAADRPWLKVKSPHFTILTDADEANGREVAWQA